MVKKSSLNKKNKIKAVVGQLICLFKKYYTSHSVHKFIGSKLFSSNYLLIFVTADATAAADSDAVVGQKSEFISPN